MFDLFFNGFFLGLYVGFLLGNFALLKSRNRINEAGCLWFLLWGLFPAPLIQWFWDGCPTLD